MKAEGTLIAHVRYIKILTWHEVLGSKLQFFYDSNGPFSRYGSHIELIRFKEYYGMPRGHGHDPLYSLSIRNMVFPCIFLGKKVIIITS